MRLFVVSASVLFLVAASFAALAGELSSPSGPVILTLRGAIERTNGSDRADFGLAMLEALPQTAVETETPWTDGKVRFDGVLLRDLLAAVGARGERLRARALNDFETEIPISDSRDYDVLVAIKTDGRYMRVRDKGPLWIVYPLSEHPKLANGETHNKMIWQLRELEIR